MNHFVSYCCFSLLGDKNKLFVALPPLAISESRDCLFACVLCDGLEFQCVVLSLPRFSFSVYFI